MNSWMISRLARCLAAGLVAFLAVIATPGQVTPEKQTPAREDDVVRVSTELVQTDVMVFDKKGRFVDQLTPDQFQLIVDGKPQDIVFFERLTSGSPPNEKNESGVPLNKSSSSRAGRIILFFIDDLHLAPDSIVRTRKALTEFIRAGVAQHDRVAITSSSGQIGFLQQFTDDKVVLQTAVARLNYRANPKLDMESPPMSEYIASKIREGDENTITYYVAEMMKQNCFRSGRELICMMDTHSARNLVILRAQQIVMQAAPSTDNTLVMLEGLMRTAAQLPGRKLLFMVSDGFYLSDRKTGSQDKIKKITDAAGRAGVVIYTMDARGLIGDWADPANNRPIESGGLLASSSMGEIAASQDGLNALAADTGGRAFRNTNLPMFKWVDKVLDETSNYYVLAWRPHSEEQKRRKFNHLNVSIKGRPDLQVRLRRGYFKTAPLPVLSFKKKTDKDPTKAREDDMRLVIDAPLVQQEIPTELSVELQQVPGVGNKLVASLGITRDVLAFDVANDKQAADVDIGGIFYDDKGKPKSSFVGRLRIYAAPNLSQQKRQALYNFQAWLPPGLYQVRVGVRDVRSGKVGSAMQWIKIPSLN